MLLALHPVPIMRREPTAADLADAQIAVVDVGHDHTPALGNFDHHQLPKDHPPTCSLSLVLQHLGLYHDARLFCPWLETAEWFDCRGPISTATWLGIERTALPKLNSPIDTTLLRRFSRAKALSPGDPLWELMRMIGQDLLEYVRTLRTRVDSLQGTVQRWSFVFGGVPATVLFVPRQEPLPDDPSLGIEFLIQQEKITPPVVALVTPDSRAAGYGMSRYEDHPALDFTRIASCPDVHFAHARGFVAKTSACDPARLRALLDQAAV